MLYQAEETAEHWEGGEEEEGGEGAAQGHQVLQTLFLINGHDYLINYYYDNDNYTL